MTGVERLRLDEADTGGVLWRRWTGSAGLLPLLFRGVTAEGLRTGGRGAIKSAAAGRRAGAAR
jgi:hypothetical protein